MNMPTANMTAEIKGLKRPFLSAVLIRSYLFKNKVETVGK